MFIAEQLPAKHWDGLPKPKGCLGMAFLLPTCGAPIQKEKIVKLAE
jgi:hypothetical protein